MKLKLTIDSTVIGCQTREQIAEMLRGVERKIRNGGDIFGIIRDQQVNNVGHWELTGDEESLGGLKD